MARISVNYVNRINQALTVLGMPELILPVDASLRQAIGTREPLAKIEKPGFWTIRHPGGNPEFDGFVRQGIEVVPKIDAHGVVWAIGLRRMAVPNPGTVEAAEGGNDGQ